MKRALTIVPVVALLSFVAVATATAQVKKEPVSDEPKWDPTEIFGKMTDIGELEPNDSPAQANTVACGDQLTPASIGVGGDRDFILFSATAGEVIQFGTDADGASPVGDTFIDLIASDGMTVLASDDDAGPGLYSLVTKLAPYTGVYYGAIRAFSATAVGSYKAFVSCLPGVPPECDLTEYKGDVQAFSPPVAIPDNVPAGVLVGQINTAPDLTKFLDVVVSIRMDHTFVGDLIATVSYDVECDGTPEASCKVMCRPGRATCVGGSGFGCSSNLSCNNLYYFSDASGVPIGSPPAGCLGTSDFLPSGCYAPSENGDPLSVFDGFDKGGCFTLTVSDNGASDTGSVCEWAVWTLNQATVPVEATTWGQLKSRYGADR